LAASIAWWGEGQQKGLFLLAQGWEIITGFRHQPLSSSSIAPLQRDQTSLPDASCHLRSRFPALGWSLGLFASEAFFACALRFRGEWGRFLTKSKIWISKRSFT
jgi:hypothetical protein